MRHCVARTLQMTGIEMTIDEAENGLVAIDRAIAIRPDLINTDLNMPEMNGQELIERVHAAAELHATKVLVLTADRYAGRSDEVLRAGAASYLTKPVTPETLKDTLLTLLPECAGIKP